MGLYYIPNLITCLRIGLVIPVVYGLLHAQYALALCAFVLAGFSDALDGFLARQYRCTTGFGSIADPLADKLLLMSSFIALSWLGQIPYWLLAVVVLRDIWIVLGVLVYHGLIGKPEFEPRLISKLNTVLQVTLIVLVLIQLSFSNERSPLVDVLMASVLTTTLASFIDYTWIWGRRAFYALRRLKG